VSESGERATAGLHIREIRGCGRMLSAAQDMESTFSNVGVLIHRTDTLTRNG